MGGGVPRLTSDSSPRAGKDRYLCSKKFSMSLIIFSISLNRALKDAGSMLEGENTLSQGARSSRWWSRALCRWTGIFLLLNPRHQRAWAPRRFLGIILDIILPRKFEVNKSICVPGCYLYCRLASDVSTSFPKFLTNQINKETVREISGIYGVPHTYSNYLS